MKLKLSKHERIKYLGFDDYPWVLIFIPLVSSFSFILFVSGREELAARSWWVCFGIGFFYTIFYWTFNRYWIIELRQRFPRLEQTRQRVIRMLAFSIGLVAAVEILPLLFMTEELAHLLDAANNLREVSFEAIASIILCLMVIGAYESVYFFKKYSDSLIEREKLAKANMHAQLAALKQQVNPHFLFNSLNTLANVIPEDPKLGVLFVQRLASVYRRVIDYRHRDLVSLEEELTALKDYVFLLNTRFENKFQIRFLHQIGGVPKPFIRKDVNPFILANKAEEQPRHQAYFDYQSSNGKVNFSRFYQAASAGKSVKNTRSVASEPVPLILELPADLVHLKIPPLSLQLLVENAVKHNVVSKASPLVVTVEITPDHVKVSNPLNLRIRREDSTGLGHQNIRQRYRLLTDREVIVSKDNEHYTVTLPLLRSQENYQHATA